MKLIDPLKPGERLPLESAKEALQAHRDATGGPSAAEVFNARPAAPQRPSKGTLAASTSLSTEKTLEQRIKEDFRVFLTLVWRFLLKVDPSPIQLDMAWWLQHGPNRAIIMAFRGFSKSWITGAYALWRLYCNPEEKILVVSGGLIRAQATTNWCLMLIMNMPILEAMIPKKNYRQSSSMFDVGNCVPAQSASFMAAGIGGQLPGWRASLIIADDVETQTNSLTVVMREKIFDGVKEFESIIMPGGEIKYLGTPHDRDSLYLNLLRLRNADGSSVYVARIWPCFFPTDKEAESYGVWLAPYIKAKLAKEGPKLIGHSTMPNRFTDEDLAQRKAAMGNTEFRLQFLLDLKGGFLNKTPLRLADLTVMDLDDKMGPNEVIWATTNLLRDMPVMGTDGDFWHGPADVQERRYQPWQKVVAHIDPSGRGADETAIAVVALLNGKVFLLHLWASPKGFEPETLLALARVCVRFRVSELQLEVNYGGGMFTSLLRPVLIAEWKRHVEAAKKAGTWRDGDLEGTTILDVKAGKAFKEKRILNVMEPVTQQHRLVVSSAVVKWDWQSVHEQALVADTGTDNFQHHRYAFGYQYTHISREPDCLAHDDRLEAVSEAVGHFADQLGIDPALAAETARGEAYEDELARLLREDDEAISGALRLTGRHSNDHYDRRPVSAHRSAR